MLLTIHNIIVLENLSTISDYGITGSPFTRKAGLEATTRSLQLSIPIATVGTFLFLLLFMKSFKYSIVTLIPILLVVIWLYGTMHLMNFGLNLVTATIGAISIGVGIDYSIHMTERFREEFTHNPKKYKALLSTVNGTGISLAASAASSIGGFIVMSQAPMPLFSSYGLITAILIHWATNYFIFSYVFAMSEITGISVESAISHSMISTLEIILVVTGIVSIAIVIMNFFNSKKDERSKTKLL